MQRAKNGGSLYKLYCLANARLPMLQPVVDQIFLFHVKMPMFLGLLRRSFRIGQFVLQVKTAAFSRPNLLPLFHVKAIQCF